MNDEIKEIRHIHTDSGKLQDSLSIGTPAKGGEIKVYTDFKDVEGTRDKILKAIEARKFANDHIGIA